MAIVGLGNVERITCVLEGVSSRFKVFSLQGTEALSRLFDYRLTLVSEDGEVDFDEVVGRPAVITILGDEESVARYLHAIVVHIEQVAHGRRLTTYSLRLAPQAWLLTRRTDCRIFQAMTTPDIIKDVLTKGGIPADRIEMNVKASYSPREYCVQYRESDFDFVARLMEEDGIFYFFKHSGEGHAMVVADHSTIHKTIDGATTLPYHPSSTGVKREDSVFPFRFRQGVRSGAVVLDDFDFRKPALDLTATEKYSVDAKLEIYDYPGRFESAADGKRLSKVLLEGLQVQRKFGEGESDCLRFMAGLQFTLDDHPRAALNQEYLLTHLEMWAKQPQVLEEGAGLELASYGNRFTCIPASVPFRAPRQTAKPVVQGVQTAIVVGPPGEEIYPDEFGRVKVQFHWDRIGANNEKSSCWIRVSQLWAGSSWGSMFVPRIGNEVIVDFVDGDPDRPIITGRVYHGTNKPPYKLPDERTKSTIKSNSSKGGGGFNELRFEDKKGNEQVFVHAEKDLDLRVKNDRREYIGNDRHLFVKRDKIQKVERDEHSLVERDQITEITRDMSLKVDGKQMIEVKGTHSMTVTGDAHYAAKGNFSQETGSNYHIKAQGIVIEGMKELTLKVGGNFVKIDSSGVTIVGTQIKLNSGGSAGSVQLGTAVPVLKPIDVVLAATAAAAPPPATEQQKKETHKDPKEDEVVPPEKKWIELEMVDETGRPIAGEKYEVELPDGKIATGTTGANGVARVNGVKPGSCKIRFPNLDQDAWEAI